MNYEEFNLFGGPEVQKLGKDRRTAALAELEQFDVIGLSEDEARALAEDIATRHNMEPAELDTTGIEVGTSYPAEVEASRIPSDWTGARGHLSGTAVRLFQRVYVPFKGNPESFAWKPSSERYDFPFPAHVEEGKLVLTRLVGVPQSAQRMKQEIDQMIEAVRSTLSFVASDARLWAIEPVILSAIQERQKQAKFAKEAAEAVGFTWRNEDEGKPKVSLMSLV